MVDPNPLSPPKPPPPVDAEGTDKMAITQTKVREFYTDDPSTDYFATGQRHPGYENNHIIYTLDYGPRGFKVDTIMDSNGKPSVWVFTTNNIDPVKLFVYKNTKDDEGNVINTNSVYLAKYDSIPFQFAVSAKPLEDFIFVGKD